MRARTLPSCHPRSRQLGPPEGDPDTIVGMDAAGAIFHRSVPVCSLFRSPFRGTRAPLARSLRMLTPSLGRAACNGPPPNRRGEMRRETRLGCIVRRMDTWRLVGDRTLDLSPQGMLVLSDERLESGTELVVSFQATELPIWFDTLASVTRVVEGRRPGDAGRAIGRPLRDSPRRLASHPARAPPPAPADALRVESARWSLSPVDLDYAQIVKDIWAGR